VSSMRAPSSRPRDADNRGSSPLRCRRARENYPYVTTGSAAGGAGDAPLASPGARWTWEEDEELVAAVRAGADLALIAEQRGRTRSAIVSRLLRMIPAREAIPEEEQLGWIMARLADPCFDWRTPLAHPRRGRRGSGAPATPPASNVGEVLDIWQRINGSELDGERRAMFLASPALGDLVQFPRRHSLGTRASSVPGAWPSAA
jgi:hypothetical protein